MYKPVVMFEVTENASEMLKEIFKDKGELIPSIRILLAGG